MTKYIIWTDKNGYMRRSLVKDTDDTSKARYGIPAGPPDLEQIDWDVIRREINNVLCNQGIYTWVDAQRNESGFIAAVNVLRRHLIALYRESNSK